MTWKNLGWISVKQGECANGSAVEDPGDNPGLVADCDALLAARDTLKGDGILNWSAEVAIGSGLALQSKARPSESLN